jgi:hypothetical protein
LAAAFLRDEWESIRKAGQPACETSGLLVTTNLGVRSSNLFGRANKTGLFQRLNVPRKAGDIQGTFQTPARQNKPPDPSEAVPSSIDYLAVTRPRRILRGALRRRITGAGLLHDDCLGRSGSSTQDGDEKGKGGEDLADHWGLKAGRRRRRRGACRKRGLAPSFRSAYRSMAQLGVALLDSAWQVSS